MSHAIIWFRRDLRLQDNCALHHALASGLKIIPVFIFDKNILDKLSNKQDSRVVFIHQQIAEMQKQLLQYQCNMQIFYGTPLSILESLCKTYSIKTVFTNTDYEPYAKTRDAQVSELLTQHGAVLQSYKDHVVFEKSEVTKDDGLPYTVYTPYSKKWMARLQASDLQAYNCEQNANNYANNLPACQLPTLASMGFMSQENVVFPDTHFNTGIISNYHNTRDIPGLEGTTKLSVHLRFGTISIRQLAQHAQQHNQKYLNELIWRDFYQQILWHFPHVVGNSFKPKYDAIQWRNNEHEFDAWCQGKTGYPIVDAGMRELNSAGWMHNRVRMIVASFLCKHLLIDWRWGEAYFAEKLNDFDLASNNGGWQWAAGSGVDAAPYFRVFNPYIQTKKFDEHLVYIKKWVPELETLQYPLPIVEHTVGRERCLRVYKEALG